MFMKESTLSLEEKVSLIQGALRAKKGAYSPHSHFPVGAALMDVNRTLIFGASIDNASYGANICAEQTAIVKAISDGKRSFIGLAVVSDVKSVITPCGICRQVLREFCPLDMPILLVPGEYHEPAIESDGNRGEHGVREITLGELLPDSSGPEYLDAMRQ